MVRVAVPTAFAETYDLEPNKAGSEIGFGELYGITEPNKPWKLDPNEPYAIRTLNPNSPLDTQFYTDIDRSPGVVEWTIPSRRSKPHEIDDYIRVSEANASDPRKLFAIVDENNIPVGWVQYYLDKKIAWLTERAKIPENALVLEISYAKLDVGMKGKNWYTGRSRRGFPQKQPRGVAVSGVRQSTEYIRQMEEKLAKISFEPVRPIWFTAYTDPENAASEQVLVKNGFFKLEEQVDYDGEMNNVWIKPPEYAITQKWKRLFERSQKEYPEDMVFIESGRIRQKAGYDCGPATVVNALGALGVEADLDALTQETRDLLSSQKLDIEDMGTPAEVMRVLLEMRNVEYVEKPSDPNSSQENIQKSLAWLREHLKTGCVCICPIQTTPEYWLADSETGQVARESEFPIDVRDRITNGMKPRYGVVHTNTDQWDGVSRPEPADSSVSAENLGVASTKDDVDYNGHYVLVVGMMKSQGRDFFITVDPSYKKWQERKSEIDPEFAGIRFIEAGLFGENWHDTSGLGEDFNQYAIAIPTSQNTERTTN